jgi:hypothetical protein
MSITETSGQQSEILSSINTYETPIEDSEERKPGSVDCEKKRKEKIKTHKKLILCYIGCSDRGIIFCSK